MGRHLSIGGAALLLTLGLLAGTGGCALRAGPGDAGGPGPVRVSFLPGPPAATPPSTDRPTTAATTTPAALHPGVSAQRSKRTPGASSPSHAPAHTTPARHAPATAPVFLPLGACAATDPAAGSGAYRQVGCTAPTAVATVIGRYPPGATIGSCPAPTDFALRLSTASGSGATPRSGGVACLRNRHSPHPGDPGGGGGVGIVPGDCLYPAGGAEVLETACDGSGPHAPKFRVNRLVAAEADCPAGTSAYIAVHNPGAPPQTACATAVRNG